MATTKQQLTLPTQREDLEHLRATLWASLEQADVAVAAQIAGQLRAVIKDLAALGPAKAEATAADEIAAKRAARRGGAADSSPASRRSQPRRRGGGNRTG